MIRRELLANGLEIVFTDDSNRYFGDYHRVCVVASIVYHLRDLPSACPQDQSFRDQAVAFLGEHLTVVKRFERMGVATADVEPVRSALIEDFMRHAADYLARPDYPRLLVTAELNKRRPHRVYV